MKSTVHAGYKLTLLIGGMHNAPDNLMKIDFGIVRKAFGKRFGDLRVLFDRHDPERILFDGNPGEYTPEVSTTILRLDKRNTEEEILDLLIVEFTAWFSEPDDETLERLTSLAADILTLKKTWGDYSTADLMLAYAAEILNGNTLGHEDEAYEVLVIIHFTDPSDKVTDKALDDFVDKYGIATKDTDLRFSFALERPAEFVENNLTGDYFRKSLVSAVRSLAYYIPRKLIRTMVLKIEANADSETVEDGRIHFDVENSDPGIGHYIFTTSPEVFLSYDELQFFDSSQITLWGPPIVNLIDHENFLIQTQFLKNHESGKTALGKLLTMRTLGLASLITKLCSKQTLFKEWEVEILTEFSAHGASIYNLVDHDGDSYSSPKGDVYSSDIAHFGIWLILKGIAIQNRPAIDREELNEIIRNPCWFADKSRDLLIKSALQLGPLTFLNGMMQHDPKGRIHFPKTMMDRLVDKYGKINDHRFGPEEGSTHYPVAKIREDVLVEFYNRFGTNNSSGK